MPKLGKALHKTEEHQGWTFIAEHWPWLLVGLVVFPAGILYGQRIYAPCDDAYIFLVYARNFVAGNGLTYNGTVVEGFSSTAWVMLLSLLGLTRVSLPRLAEALSILSGLLALLATYALGRRLRLGALWALIPPILLVATGDFAIYMSVGLEQILFTALVALGAFFVYSKAPASILRSYLFPFLMVVTILTRPEGALVSALFLIVLAFRSRSILLPIRCGILLILMLAPTLVVKWAYYGYPLPNTYYVKSNIGLSSLLHGLLYVIESFARYGVVLALTILLLLYVLRKNKLQALDGIWPLAFVSVVWVVYVLVQGGDHMVGGRALIPILPLVYVGLARLTLGACSEPRIILAGTGLLCLLLIGGYLFDPSVAAEAAGWRDAYPIRRDAGIHLRESFAPNTLVALNPAGIIPYYSQLPTIDMLGLNDTHIAHQGKRDYSLRHGHQAGDGLYVLSRQPDVILFGGSLNERPTNLVSDIVIWESSIFQEDYQPVEWSGIGFAYVRRSSVP